MAPKRRNSKAAHQLGIGGTTVAGKQEIDAPLTERQRLFIKHLVHDKLPNGAAARAAGYSPTSASMIASELLRNPKVVAAIAEEREAYAKASGMTKQKVIDGFAEAIDLARIKADPIAMIAGWREIGKMCGFYEPTKAELRVTVQGKVMLDRLNQMSDAQLLELLENESANRVLEGDFTVLPPPGEAEEDENGG